MKRNLVFKKMVQLNPTTQRLSRETYESFDKVEVTLRVFFVDLTKAFDHKIAATIHLIKQTRH